MAQVFESAIDADRCDTECLHPEVVRPILGRTLGTDGANEVADLFAVLGDPSRVRILHLLSVSPVPLCVCDIALVLGMSVSALSHQLGTLRERGVVHRDKVGRIAYYTLIDAHIRTLVSLGVAHIAEGAA